MKTEDVLVKNRVFQWTDVDEKFNLNLSRDTYIGNQHLIVKSMEEFSIGFAEWTLINYPNQYKLYKNKDERGFYTTKKLLEIYKNENKN